MLATKVLLAFWRQLRAWNLERGSIGRAASSISASPGDTSLTLTDRAGIALESLGVNGRFAIGEYEARFDRQFARALNALHRYRSARLAVLLLPPEMHLCTRTREPAARRALRRNRNQAINLRNLTLNLRNPGKILAKPENRMLPDAANRPFFGRPQMLGPQGIQLALKLRYNRKSLHVPAMADQQ